jgi:hypothetical protein
MSIAELHNVRRHQVFAEDQLWLRSDWLWLSGEAVGCSIRPVRYPRNRRTLYYITAFTLGSYIVNSHFCLRNFFNENFVLLSRSITLESL